MFLRIRTGCGIFVETGAQCREETERGHQKMKDQSLESPIHERSQEYALGTEFEYVPPSESILQCET